MRKRIFFNFLLFPMAFIILLGSVSDVLIKQPDDQNLELFRQVSKHVDENERCFKCHGGASDMNEQEGTDAPDSSDVKKLPVITRQEFYNSNHKSLACLGCHADPTPESPDRTSKVAASSRTCTDCHKYIKNHQKYQFAAIEEEYLQSVHYQKKQSEFSCWKCHNPHKYKNTIRNTENVPAAIAYDNEICTFCHTNTNPFSILDNNGKSDTIKMHIWLPELEKHFRSVRCIDCHTKINENVLVAHQVLQKEKAVRRCSECHSRNSILLTTLYKQQYGEAVAKSGFFNSVVMKDVYIVGGNRSKTLNIICLIFSGITFAVMLIHMIPRIVKKTKT
jgi:hypothetical protein